MAGISMQNDSTDDEEDDYIDATIAPNKQWLAAHAGGTVRLEWPDESFEITIRRDHDDG